MELIARDPDAYVVEALTAGRNVSHLAEQARALRPKLAVIADPAGYEPLRDALSGTGIEVAAGAEAVVEAAQRPAGWVMAAIVGAAGLEPTLAATRRGAIVAFANKECLVCAGPLMMDLVRDSGATLLPVDSEHNAIFQVFDFERRLDPPADADRIGRAVPAGRPRTPWPPPRRRRLCAHPTWPMGAKISVDSATMMNKGLEIIEAHFLFDSAGRPYRRPGPSAVGCSQHGRICRWLGPGPTRHA